MMDVGETINSKDRYIASFIGTHVITPPGDNLYLAPSFLLLPPARRRLGFSPLPGGLRLIRKY